MAYDYKKEYKEFYMPKNKPAIVTIPKMNYISAQKFLEYLDSSYSKRNEVLGGVLPFGTGKQHA